MAMKPSRYKSLAGIVLTLLFMFQGLYLVGFSLKEGAGLFSLIAVGIIVAPIALLWLVYAGLQRSTMGSWKYVLAGALIAVIFELLLPVSPFSTTLVSAFQQRAVNAVTAGNVVAEPLPSIRGNPIGIRLAFDLRFPRDGSYAVSATLLEEEPLYHHYLLGMSHLGGITVTPEAPPNDAGERWFRADTNYRMQVDFLPGFLHKSEFNKRERKAGDFCLYLRDTPQLDRAGVQAILRDGPVTSYYYEISIGTGSYFVRRNVAAEGIIGTFRPGDFHASAMKEGAGECGF